MSTQFETTDELHGTRTYRVGRTTAKYVYVQEFAGRGYRTNDMRLTAEAARQLAAALIQTAETFNNQL